LSIGIIIQARIGSTRLPGKVLNKIGDKNLLEHVLYRLSKLKHSTKIVIATTDLEQDNDIEDFCIENDVRYFRGSELNVLERYYLCAKQNSFDHVVRITGDNPFIDIYELDNLIKLHLDTSADYSRSFAQLPKGCGSEIFNYTALEKSYKLGNKENHKEHVNEYIEENEDEFQISELTVKKEKNRPDLSLTVDTKEDYDQVCYIVKKTKNEYITTEEAIKLCLQYV